MNLGAIMRAMRPHHWVKNIFVFAALFFAAGEKHHLDWSNVDVRSAMMDTLRFWLDRGVDGLFTNLPARMRALVDSAEGRERWGPRA